MRTSVEAVRGCGFRKPGGLYLVSDGPGEDCDRLPAEMHVCPTCSQGIKPARGFTYVDGGVLFPPEMHGGQDHNARCPFGDAGSGSKLGRCGLLWIGEAFYKTPADFTAEAVRMGISRRITAVPRDFIVCETWVLLGHRKCVPAGVIDQETETHYETLRAALEAGVNPGQVAAWWKPGIFYVFRPQRVEYVVRPEDENDPDFLASLEKRGIEPVKVIRETNELPLDTEV